MAHADTVLRNPDDTTLKELLKSSHKIAVIGLSPVASRPSNGVTQYMINQGYEIYGVRPGSPTEILGRRCVETLTDLHEDIDIFDVFRNSESVPGLVVELEAWLTQQPDRAKPRTLWLQEGVGNRAAEIHARALGLMVVTELCILKEHARLLRR